MKHKLFIWIGMFLINISIAFAQTGLFSSSGATTFAVTGIIIVVIIIVFKEIFKNMFKSK